MLEQKWIISFRGREKRKKVNELSTDMREHSRSWGWRQGKREGDKKIMFGREG